MKKTCWGFRTKIEAVVVLLLLVTISVSAVTIKLGTDASGNTWGIGGYNVISNSNGNVWEATGTNIQVAITDAGVGGTTVLPSGQRFTINDIITVPANATLDLNNAELICGSPYENPRMISGNNFSIIKNGVLDGNDLAKTGIAFYNKHNAMVTGMEITGCEGVGVTISDGSDNMTITNNYIHDLPENETTGLSYGIVNGANSDPINHCYNNVISYNIIENVDGNGISVTGGSDHFHYDLKIIGNTIDTTTSLDCIQLYYGNERTIISDNHFKNWDRTGVKLDGSNDCIISNNVFYDDDGDGTDEALTINTRNNLDSDRNVVTDNTFYCPDTSQVVVVTGSNPDGDPISCDNNIISNNIFYDNEGSIGTINCIHAHYTVVTGNILKESNERGITINHCHYSVVNDNKFYVVNDGKKDDGYGIYANDSNYITINDNYFYNPEGSGSTPYVIGVNNSTSFTVNGNFIENYDSTNEFLQAIEILSGCDRGIVSFNHLIVRDFNDEYFIKTHIANCRVFVNTLQTGNTNVNTQLSICNNNQSAFFDLSSNSGFIWFDENTNKLYIYNEDSDTWVSTTFT